MKTSINKVDYGLMNWSYYTYKVKYKSNKDANDHKCDNIYFLNVTYLELKKNLF